MGAGDGRTAASRSPSRSGFQPQRRPEMEPGKCVRAVCVSEVCVLVNIYVYMGVSECDCMM